MTTTRAATPRGRFTPRPACLVLLAACITACTEPLEFPDWTLPVPQGTTIIEYASVAADARVAHEIDLRDEQVFGAEEAETRFYRARDVAADAAGNVYVLDEGADEVKVFDPAGAWLRTLGGPGKGPGELSNALSMVFVDDRVVVSDSVNLRLSQWSPAGKLIGDFRLGSLMQFLTLDVGPGAEHLVGVHIDIGDDGLQHDFVSAVSLAGDELFRYTELTHPERPRVPNFGMFPVISLPLPQPRGLAGPNGLVYVTDRREYQIIALSASGQAAWALRVAQPRRTFAPDDVQRYLLKAREKRPETRENEFDWPDRFPALERIAVDGRGFLYVFPFVPADERAERVPVDVYSPEGERVFAGTIPDVRWTRAYGDHVYRVGIDAESEEYRAWRYRLVTPF